MQLSYVSFLCETLQDLPYGRVFGKLFNLS